MRRVWDAGFCADWGVGLFAAGRGKCGMGIMKSPLQLRGGLSICHLLFRQDAADLAGEVERAPGADGVVLTCKR